MSESRSVFGFKYGIFDLDGTLVDSVPTFCEIFAQCVAPYGIAPADAAEFYRATTGQPMEKQFRELLERFGHAPDTADVVRVKKQADDEFLKRTVRFFPAARTLVRLRAYKWTYNFLSSASSDKNVRKRLAEGWITAAFTRHRGSTAVPKGPEHVAIFAQAVKESVEAFSRQAFFCGDGEADMRIGKTHGMYAIGIAGTVTRERLFAAGADRVVDSISELVDDE